MRWEKGEEPTWVGCLRQKLNPLCPNQMQCDNISVTSNLSVQTRRDKTRRHNKINQNHNQSEKLVGGVSLNKMDT